MINIVLFKNRWSSYLTAALLGIAAGLMVAFFVRFPSDDLWGLSLFSSETCGFWLFTCSLIALLSSKHYAAGINVSLYVYFMFYVTGIFKRLAVVEKGNNSITYFYRGFYQELTYGLVAAGVCFILAFILWYGRKKKPVCIIIRFAPLALIVAEAIWLWLWVIMQNCCLFMAIVDTLCSIAYLLIIVKRSDFKAKSAMKRIENKL